jgi:hypothetical protein
MKNLTRKVLKALSLVTGSFIIVLMFFAGGFILGESYSMVDPFADTEMAPDYTPEKFKLVKEGMHMSEVIRLVGEPINKDYDTLQSLTGNYYTRDGYLMKRTDKRLSLLRDIAWFGSEVRYNKDSIAVKVYSRWYYD